MKHKICNTVRHDYWIHVDNQFFYYQTIEEMAKDVYIIILPCHYSLVHMYKRNFLIDDGKSITHFEKTSYSIGDISEHIYSYKHHKNYVISHDVGDVLYNVIRQERLSRISNSKKHTKCHSYRKIRTTQEKRVWHAGIVDAQILKNDYGLTLKNTRNVSNYSLPNTWDDLSFISENNWKSSKKKYRKQWMKKACK